MTLQGQEAFESFAFPVLKGSSSLIIFFSILQLYWSVHSTNKNPEYFPEPEKFDPSRFEGKGPAPYTFIPFGGGPRMCPGKEFAKLQMLVFLHNLVKRFRWEAISPDEKMVIDPMPRPMEGLPLRLHPHHS